MNRRWKNEVVKNWKGKPIRLPVVSDNDEGESEVKDGKLVDVMRLLLVNSEFKTVEDSREGRRLIELVDKSKNASHIEMESGSHNWFKEKIKPICPPIFKFDGDEIYQLINEGYERVNEKKGAGESEEKSSFSKE